jgi:hypothetical protein
MRQRPGWIRGPARKPGAIKQPSGLDAHPVAGPRPPEYVIVLWTTEQLRDRLQRNNATLAQELHDRSRHRQGRTAEPGAEIEAEP